MMCIFPRQAVAHAISLRGMGRFARVTQRPWRVAAGAELAVKRTSAVGAMARRLSSGELRGGKAGGPRTEQGAARAVHAVLPESKLRLSLLPD